MTHDEIFDRYPELEGPFLDLLEELELNADESLADDPESLSALVLERIRDGRFEDADRIRFFEGPLNNPHNTCEAIVWLGEEWGFEP